jgi:branched-chain amino acid transport system permease protein
MAAFAWVVERLVLRHLVNQDAVVLLMATLGVAYFLDGFGQTDLGQRHLQDRHRHAEDARDGASTTSFEGGILINTEDFVAGGDRGTLLVLALAIFFQKTATGRALRAVADDHQAAQSIGIPLNRIWVIVWTVAGFVALVAGMIWGSKLGVQFSLSADRAEGAAGGDPGRLHVGAGRHHRRAHHRRRREDRGSVPRADPRQAFDLAGGGIENWFAYVLALLFLLVRPEGLFGEKHITGSRAMCFRWRVM